MPVIVVVVIPLWLTGCASAVPATSHSPIGGGLAIIGLGLVIAAFLLRALPKGGEHED